MVPVSNRACELLDEARRPDDEGCVERGRPERGVRSRGCWFGATVASESAKVVGCSAGLTGVPHAGQNRALSESG
jgi:hypothetical protein